VKILLIILSLVVLLSVAGGVLLGTGTGTSFQIGTTSSRPTGTPVRLHEVGVGSLTEAISAPGIVRPKTDVDISARFTARVARLPFEEGDLVSEGDVVVELDARELEAQLQQTKAQLVSEQARIEGLRSSLKVAESEWKRQQGLYETGDVSLANLERAESTYFSLRADLEASIAALGMTEARITQAEEQLSYTTLTSPIDGRITVINAEVGETVVAGTMNNMGTVILSIADFSEMIVQARVDETDVVPVQVSQPAKIYINAYPDDVFEGVVKQIALNRSTDNTGAGFFQTEIAVTTDDRQLFSGLSANVDIEVASHEEQLIVPSQSVQERLIEDLPLDIVDRSDLIDRTKRYANIVYRFVDGKAVATPVKVGASDLINTVVLEGLEPGDRVVEGPFKVLMTIKHDQELADQEELDRLDREARARREGVAADEETPSEEEGAAAPGAENEEANEPPTEEEEEPTPSPDEQPEVATTG
jgi:HlyD family secretion protein